MISTDSYYVREADRIARGPQLYGGNAAIVGMRAFIRYHKDARQDVPIAGRMRSLTHKQVTMLGLFSRLEVTREHATIRAMAQECHVAPSTVSRFMDKVQAWGEYAIDRTRGRYANVTIRRRQVGDQLADYAKRAWERIKRAADRAAFNVASTLRLRSEGYVQPENEQELRLLTSVVVMDATLNEAWDAVELRLRAEVDRDPPVAPLPRGTGGFNPGRLTAENVIAERRWLDANDPDWDLVAEEARDRWLS